MEGFNLGIQLATLYVAVTGKCFMMLLNLPRRLNYLRNRERYRQKIRRARVSYNTVVLS